MHGGIATHYCDSSKIHDLERALIELENMDAVENVLDKFCPKVQSEFSLAKHLDQINRCFGASTVEGILKNLEDDGTQWAEETIKVSFFKHVLLEFRFINRCSFILPGIEISITNLFEVNTTDITTRIEFFTWRMPANGLFVNSSCAEA